jgi:hypothetical protein
VIDGEGVTALLLLTAENVIEALRSSTSAT